MGKPMRVSHCESVGGYHNAKNPKWKVLERKVCDILVKIQEIFDNI
jgi:hypothetical protein